MKGLIVLGAVVALVAIMFVVFKTDHPSVDEYGRGKCPDHWHVGFDAYYPDAAGAPVRVNFAQPRWNNNPSLAYYEFANGAGERAGGMSLQAHLHMGGARAEQGASADYNQFHLEDQGRCVSLHDMFAAGDVHLGADSFKTDGGHASIGQGVDLHADGTNTLRVWIQNVDGNWTEHPYNDVKGDQVKDGESVLVAFGHYSDAQVKTMQDAVRQPASRAGLLQYKATHS